MLGHGEATRDAAALARRAVAADRAAVHRRLVGVEVDHQAAAAHGAGVRPGAVQRHLAEQGDEPLVEIVDAVIAMRHLGGAGDDDMARRVHPMDLRAAPAARPAIGHAAGIVGGHPIGGQRHVLLHGAHISGQEGAWQVRTSRGTVKAEQVVIATNGYTGDITPDLKRRVVPLASHIIATEELPADLADSLIPKRRTLSDTRRVLCYYRMTPDGKRMVFGGRARFTQVSATASAPILYDFMTARFPQLKGVKVTHAWTGNVAFTLDALPHMGKQADGMHYLLGCNGSGVAMMTYLGTQTARKIARVANAPCAFDMPEFPDHPLYNGNPWFLPVIGGWYRMRDRLDRMLA